MQRSERHRRKEFKDTIGIKSINGFRRNTIHFIVSQQKQEIELEVITRTRTMPEAQQLLGVKAEGNKLVAVTLYADQDAMERASASRKKVLDANQDMLSVDTMVGSVELNHS